MPGEILLQEGIRLIALADEGYETEMIDQAIEELKLLKHTRTNIPF